MSPSRAAVAVLTAVAVAAFAAPAHAAKSCSEPRVDWQRATPAEAALDAAKLQDAIDYGTSQASYAIRVYRNGCLVGEDRAANANRSERYESFSMAKSVTSLLFGRAMTLGLISPDDPVGSLVPEADAGHGAITMRDILTMSSGVRWNGFRDYNVFTMPDRVHDALTLDIVKPRGTYFEYAQSPVALLVEAVARATGEDPMAFIQRELMTPLGIAPGTWSWERDKVGHIQGFWGVGMRPDDYGRLGEVLRRGGVWRGRRLLSRRYVREAIAPSATNGCYGWLIWVNAAAPCIGPTVSDRPVESGRDFPEFPADMYEFAGLFGQRVTTFPAQGLLIVRTGQDPGLVPAGETTWEPELYRRVLAAITDKKAPPPPPANAPPSNQQDPDYGFQTALREPDQYSQGVAQTPLPPAGPERARAARLRLANPRPSRRGIVTVRMTCPARWPGREARRCVGTATLEDARRALPYDLAPGETRILRFRLSAARLRALRRVRYSAVLTAGAINTDAVGGTDARIGLTVRPPRAPRAARRSRR